MISDINLRHMRTAVFLAMLLVVANAGFWLVCLWRFGWQALLLAANIVFACLLLHNLRVPRRTRVLACLLSFLPAVPLVVFGFDDRELPVIALATAAVALVLSLLAATLHGHE